MRLVRKKNLQWLKRITKILRPLQNAGFVTTFMLKAM